MFIPHPLTLYLSPFLLGQYDVGIVQLQGNKIELVGKPRTFCFGGVDAKDERVHVYQVAVDSG